MGITLSVGFFILLFTIVTTLLITGFVYNRNPRSATNTIFAFLGVVISLWLVFMYISVLPHSLALSLILIRLTLFLATPMTFLFFLLAHTLPNERIQLPRWVFFSLNTIVLSVMILTLTPYMFTSVEIVNNSPTPTPGIGLIPFALFAVSMTLASVITLYIHRRKASGRERAQVQLIMTGILLMYSALIITVLIPVGLLKINFFVQFAPLYTIAFLVTTAYAIIKHRFLDISFLVARTISFTAIIVISAVLYSLIFTFLLSKFTNASLTATTLGIATFLTLVMATSFQWIKRGIEKITDRFFYKNHYSTSKLLYDLSLEMASTVRLEQLLNHMLTILTKQLRISKASFILINKDSIYEIAQHGYDAIPIFDGGKIISLINQNHLIIFDELPEGELKEIMRNYSFSIAISVQTEGKSLGLLALGEKLSGDIYNQVDLRVISIFAPEAAIAIQNSIAYEEIRRFNITLQEKVNLATQDLQSANAQLKTMDKLKDEFISVASHELRTPMTAVKSYLWMVINKAQHLDAAKQKLYLERAYNSTNRLIILVNDMLNVSRIESGRITLHPVDLSLGDLAHEVIEELIVKASEKKISIRVANTPTHSVYADHDKIQEVFINIIGNALKFTPEGGSITVSFAEQGQMIETAITDTGKGISQDDIPRLFQKFSRIENTLSSVAETEGTGLGLYICKQFIELSGGKVGVTSQINHGTTFTFTLPIHGTKETTTGDSQASQPLVQNASTSPLIPPTPTPSLQAASS